MKMLFCTNYVSNQVDMDLIPHYKYIIQKKNNLLYFLISNFQECYCMFLTKI